MDKGIELLRKSAVQFRYYAQQHLKKALDATDDETKQVGRMKSAINLSLAEQIEDYLRDLHNSTYPLGQVEAADPITPENMTKEDWQRSLGLD